ncbi:MAG: hypothetical protein EU529_16950 [Promethearchaeota archaeon]|nr:MAG: hypothetical protein EU529_16950 [Candidatus Lokiarchaeota archaeon]
MKLFLDSTYLIPAFNVDITEGWSKKDLKNLIQNEIYELYYCDLSLFEIYTKCMKLLIQNKLNIKIEEIQNGLQSIINSSRLIRINWWEHIFETDILLSFKKIHNDSIDCILVYLAIVNCDIFATFDDTLIKKVKKEEILKDFIKEVNPQFKYWLNNLSGRNISLLK